MKLKNLLPLTLTLGLVSPLFGVVVDSKLSKYRKVNGVSGTLKSLGSDTLNNMMALWAEAFLAIFPNVKIQIWEKGSSSASPALIEGTSQHNPLKGLSLKQSDGTFSST